MTMWMAVARSLVDDAASVLLEAAGHLVETFESAVDFPKSDTSDLACLVLDHHMPHMTGLEVAERLRADRSGLSILLITALRSPTMLARVTELGIDKDLEKTIYDKELFSSVNALRP
jgi:FixJ family two-component response regulator